MADRSTLSAALCTYNHATYLEEALVALLTQSRAPDQVVVVDDCSSDGTPALLARLQARFPALEVVRNDRNRGVLESFERALSLVRGDLLYVGASDDYVLGGVFEALAGALEDFPEAAAAFGRMAQMDERGRRVAVHGVTRWSRPLLAEPARYLRDVLSAEAPSFSLCSATVWRRAALMEVGGFRRELGPFADTFALHAMALRHGVCYVPAEFAAWRAVSTGYAQSLARDPRRALETVENVVAAMREPGHRSYFPSAFVERWREEYRALILETTSVATSGVSLNSTETPSSWSGLVALGIRAVVPQLLARVTQSAAPCSFPRTTR